MIDYQVFMKHAEKVTKNAAVVNTVRTVLFGIKHMENGDAIVTDSHRLYVAKNVHDRTDGAIITPGGKIIDDKYPDVQRLIPDPSYAKQTLELEVKELLRAADMFASVGAIAELEADTKKPPGLEFKEDLICYSSYQVKINYSINPISFNERICANAIYVLDAMKLFKAAEFETVTFNYFGAMRPFTLTNADESLLVLILPIRKY
jgi:hypothetical protein